MRKPIISVTAQDLKWTYFNGEGKGGSNRNKTQCGARCLHEPSGAMGVAQDERSLVQNKKLAFKRMVATKKFQTWIKTETMRRSGELDEIERKVEEEMKKIRVDLKDDNGKWVPEVENDGKS